MAWHKQGPVNTLDKEVKEHGVQGERGANICHNSILQDKKAPKAEPEEDIEDIECRNQEPTSTNQENQEVAKKFEQVLKTLSPLQLAKEESEETVDQFDDCLTPPPSFSVISTRDFCEKELFFSLECEVTGEMSDVKINSDTKDDLNSPDSQDSQERPRTPQFLGPIDEETDAMSEEMMGKENIKELRISKKNNTSQPACHSPSDSNASDGNTVSSPPFADECEEEEEMSVDFISCVQQKNTLDVSSKAFLLSYSASDHAGHSAKQQEVPLPQSQHEPNTRGVNQEATQQVLSQGSPPLSSVAMELSNQGGAGSQGSGYVLTVRERHSRAGEDTEGKKEQTGEEKGQKESRSGRNKPAGEQYSGQLLRYSQTVLVQDIKTDRHHCGVSLKHTKHTRMENDLCDDSQSDSGVSDDFSPYSTLEDTTTSTGSPTTPKETPIEREIRRAIARENSLRRSRGLPNPPSSPEYVDFPLKKNLRQSITTKSERYQDKDREFAGKKMQHEIYAEAQREQDLVKLGKVPGFYDKGIDRQIKETKLIFEAFQTPSDSTFTTSTRSKSSSSSSSSSDASTLGNQDDRSSSSSSTVGSSSGESRHSLDVLSPTPCLTSAQGGGITNSHPRGPGFSEGSGSQVIIFENNLGVPPQKHYRYHVKSETEAVTEVDSGYQKISSSRAREHHHYWLSEKGQKKEDEEKEEEEVAIQENPFFKLRTSTNLVKVKRDIQEAQKREKELRKQRISLYGGSGGAKGGGGLMLTSMERKSLPSSFNGLGTPGSSYRVETGTSGVRQVSKSSMWPPVQTEEEMIYRAKVLQSPRTPRQKTPLVQRWESGLINGHNREDD